MTERLFLDERNLQEMGFSQPNIFTMRKLTEFLNTLARVGTAESDITALGASKQPLDADLTALAALSSTGMLARTAAATYATRTLTAGSGVSIANGDGVSGNPTISASASGYEGGPATAPTVASLTWVNQDTSTATDGTGGLILKPQVNAEIHSLVKSTPAAPFDVYCRTEAQAISSAANTANAITIAGLAFRDSSDGEMVIFGISWERVSGDEQNLHGLGLWRSTLGTAITTTVINRYTGAPWKWLRANVTSTTLTLYASLDGKDWHQITTETIATMIDTVDQYGVFAFGNADATEVAAKFSYFSTTAPV